MGRNRVSYGFLAGYTAVLIGAILIGGWLYNRSIRRHIGFLFGGLRVASRK